ncbi:MULTISPECIES: carbohydrate ABC transporter permease [unclassified Paenibacillus]|uniref:carbohydrate ABC transporter permease n=1 Tax=unclassified Paenibacillus TaxID=185978 RepID=UPI0010521B1B|nr:MULTISPECIES: carbohydrate ABC transporter permease [unclassified Paenibacillus]NIK70016.1 putative aldouronate transport system permease protein [Paenibacillus sp. BK720]TCM97848.1 putative aldouronate transport system permease protein [Paenibacillus sp. BK033]
MAAISDKNTAGSNPKNRLSAAASSGINIFFILYSALCVIPLLLLLSVSFSDERSVLTHGYRFIPEKFNLAAYAFLYKDIGQIAYSYGISITVTIVGTVLSMLIIALYAYPISRSQFPHARFFTFFVFFTMLFSGGLVPWYLVYVQMLNLKDTLWALIMPLLVSSFWVLIVRTFFKETIPAAVLESAKIDGAGELRIFIRIVLPLSMPVLATVALFQTLTYWNDWFLSLVFITNDHNISVQYLLYKMLANIQYLSSNPTAAAEIARAGGMFNFPSETVRMALVVVGIGPIVFAYPFFQKYFVRGLTVGAVKG